MSCGGRWRTQPNGDGPSLPTSHRPPTVWKFSGTPVPGGAAGWASALSSTSSGAEKRRVGAAAAAAMSAESTKMTIAQLLKGSRWLAVCVTLRSTMRKVKLSKASDGPALHAAWARAASDLF